jgi:hypothetical protein
MANLVVWHERGKMKRMIALVALGTFFTCAMLADSKTVILLIRYRNINYFNYFICKSDTGGGYGIALDAGYALLQASRHEAGFRKVRNTTGLL